MFRYRAAYCAALAAAILFFIFFKEYLSFFTLIFVLLLPFISWMFMLPAVRKTTVELQIKNSLADKNEDFSLLIVLKNASALPVARAQIRFFCENSLSGEEQNQILVLPISAHTEQNVEYRMQSGHIGRVTAELTQIRYYDFLGIFTLKLTPNAQAEIFITPKIHLIDGKIDLTAAAGMENSSYSKVKPGDDPSEIFDVRAFRSGDRLRSIHWKLSSKLDELMVKEFSLPANSELLLLVELLAPDMTVLDALIETAASLSHFFSENQISHRIEWFDKKKNQFHTASIENDEDLAVLLNGMLSSQYNEDEPYALDFHGKTEKAAESFSHAIYITGKLTNTLSGFCDRPNKEKITVLLISEQMDQEQQRLADGLHAMGAAVVTVYPEKIQQSLSGLIL
nr:DUF58 domain-containing protein [uncultured Caproiciproducens sp.]